MKHLSITAVLLLSLAITATAGTNDAGASDTKIVTPTEAPFKTGLYLAPDGGFNVYRANPDAGRPGIGDRNVDVGGYVGGKIGYIFNTGVIEPAIEADMFYNRFGGGWDRVYWMTQRHKEFENYQTDSGAFLANELIRFNLGAFQPYIGAGIGLYTASTDRQQKDTNYYSGKQYSYASFHSNNTSWAWQAVAGADYYVSHNISLFLEYKFLNYMETAPDGRLGQHLVGAGVRYFF